MQSGYRTEFLPLYIPTNAPLPPHVRGRAALSLNTEAIYMSTLHWKKRTSAQSVSQAPEISGGEYLTFWYVGQIPHDAVSQSVCYCLPAR